ncbi:MAG: hypothetical protein LWW85_10670 [Marinilabiliales bacterium]|nr:hypothetical protein [Marinilabiliales bacterium]
MKHTLRSILLGGWLLLSLFSHARNKNDDLLPYALQRKQDLQLSTYATAHCLRDYFADEAGRKKVLQVLKEFGITKIYLEVYRSGLVLTPDFLKICIDFLKENGMEIVGGIATVPGDDFACKQEGPLTWCNWQDPKTRADFSRVMRTTAPLFDTFVIDDFLCTADTSQASKMAKGERSWSAYRRELLSELERDALIRPAREANPHLTIIIKYPQWYDRFHLFGYDVEKGPHLFDRVWVGTESRGQYTQRYGFVQPYEGFINYRWIASLSGNKIGAAWFDYGDCTAEDFVEQAWQSALAGAREFVFFSLYDLLQQHPGNQRLKESFPQLADLSATVAHAPVVGPMAYKPPQSDAGGDLYLLDVMGMFGTSLIPSSTYPSDASILFLPTQAGTDQTLAAKVEASLKAGKRVILTTGLLSTAPEGEKLAKLAGFGWPIVSNPVECMTLMDGSATRNLALPLKLECSAVPEKGEIQLAATKDGHIIPFLIKSKTRNAYLLNVHTFSEADFKAVGEVLLSPRQLGILDVPENWANLLRSAFEEKGTVKMTGPARVALQRLSNGELMIQNYNREPVEITLVSDKPLLDRLTNKVYTPLRQRTKVRLEARSRVWFSSFNGEPTSSKP